MKPQLPLLAFVAIFLTGCFVPPDPDTNVKHYPRVLDDWKKSGLVEHFPNPIPPAAANIKFSSFPGFLQGGAWIQVRFELPGPEVLRIFDEAGKRARQFHDGGNAVTLLNRQADGLRSGSFHTSGANEQQFPEDYRIFIFAAKPYQNGSDFDWNHGTSRGLAVSKSRNEVIYWAENW